MMSRLRFFGFILLITGMTLQTTYAENPGALDLKIQAPVNADYLEPGIGYHFFKPLSLPYHEIELYIDYRHTFERGLTLGTGMAVSSTFFSAVFGLFANLASVFETTEEEEYAGEQILPFDISKLNQSVATTLSLFGGYAFRERVYLENVVLLTYAYLPDEEFIHNFILGNFVRFRFYVMSLGIGCDILQFNSSHIAVDPAFRLSAGIVIPFRL
jgi:hypothetical protein